MMQARHSIRPAVGHVITSNQRAAQALVRKSPRAILLILMLIVFSASHAAEPTVPAIILADGRTVVLSPSALAQLPKQVVTAASHGKTASYEGYDLRAVLGAAGVTPIENLRGKQLTAYITVTAADDYKVVFGMGELDRTLGNTLVLLTHTENKQPLAKSDGPWRLVVPGDKRPARWVRQVISIRVSR